MSLGTYLAHGRALAEDLMVDAVRVVRAGEPVWDEGLGEYVTSESVVYVGKARVRTPRAVGNRVDEQGAAVTVQELVLWLPVASSGAVDVDDVAELTASAADPAMVGLRLRISREHWQSHSTARRFAVEVES